MMGMNVTYADNEPMQVCVALDSGPLDGMGTAVIEVLGALR